MNFDVLASPFNFYLPDGNSEFKTFTGGCAFLLFLILFSVYFLTTMVAFFSRTRFSILDYYQENSVNGPDQSFGRKNNFAIAATFSRTTLNGNGSMDDP